MALCARKDVPVQETWDLGLIFAEESQMWEALDALKKQVRTFVDTYAGKLTTAEKIVACLDEQEAFLPEHLLRCVSQENTQKLKYIRSLSAAADLLLRCSM